MNSNFIYGGPGYQNPSTLSYPFKNLSLGSSQAYESTPNPHGLSTMNSFQHSMVGAHCDHTILNTYRPMGSRFFTTPECGPSNLRAINTRTPVHPNPPISAPSIQKGPVFRMPANPVVANKFSESENQSQPYNFRPRLSGSRVLSSLQNAHLQSFNNNMNTDAFASFLSNRLDGPRGDNMRSDGPTSALQQNTSPPQSFDNMLSLSHSFDSGFMHSLVRPTSQTTMPNILNSSNLPQSSCPSEQTIASESPMDGNFPCSGGNFSGLSNSGTQYYSSHHIENTRKLQASGQLKTAYWVLVPPVPEDTTAYMRTGRSHELKSRACNDRVFNACYMDQELKQALRNKLQACLFTADEFLKEKLPKSLGAYTDLVPLENLQHPRLSVTFGLPGICFKAWSPRFNRPMLLRRVILPSDHNPSLVPDAYYLAKHLSELDHVAVVGFRDIFFTNAFGDNSVVLVYEYAPCSYTLQQAHMSDPMKLTSFTSPFNVNRTARPHSAMKNGPSDLGMPQESVLWSYLIQLTNGLRFIHQHVHKSCGTLDPTKVLIQDGTRLKINCFGLKDLLFYSSQDTNLSEHQATDFVHLGKLMLGVACGTAAAVQASQRVASFNLLQQFYRAELVTVIRSLISGQISTIDQLVRATAPFAYDHLTRVYDHVDFMERQLFLEMECDRLFRLVCKLQSIVERSDRQGTTPEWSETGDRYMLKLFRDFVFHQTDQLGAPYLDLAHIITTLNKVEAASRENLCLISRDSQNVIIVTYADIKQWLDTSFTYLLEKHRHSRCELQLAQQYQQQQHQFVSSGEH